MARARTAGRPAEAGTPDLLAAAFALLAETGWAGFSPRLLAERSGASLAEVYDFMPTTGQLPQRLGERLDRAMLAIEPDEPAGLSHRERLFELVMRRLDPMAPFKPGLARPAREARGEVELWFASLQSLDRMARWLSDLAGLPYRGLEARLARRALMLAYARVFRVWLDDDTADLAKTMAALDQRLDQLERLADLGDRITGALAGRRHADGRGAD